MERITWGNPVCPQETVADLRGMLPAVGRLSQGRADLSRVGSYFIIWLFMLFPLSYYALVRRRPVDHQDLHVGSFPLDGIFFS